VCRPSCATRKSCIKNVVIFSSLEEALEKGYRCCKRCCPDKKGWNGTKSELAENAKSIIESGYYDKFAVKAVAEQLFVNESYLIRTFKEVTGMTMLGYHNHIRCEKAREMLEKPELAISYISDVVGYNSPSHFTRIFRKEYGCTPSEYRNRYLEMLDRNAG
jgi:AraC family transcriptional regulator of adaptative response / methylphosphotriester-DNA alkyltransferase methyltransferase